MPEICRFYGIRITIYFDEHPPSHFHAEYGGDEAVFSVDTGNLLQGQIPKTAERLVKNGMCCNEIKLGRYGIKSNKRSCLSLCRR